jgi:DNA-damage-inducible protein J
MATISVRIDEQTKNQLDSFCRDVGSNTSTIMKMFATKVAREQRLPFTIELDPFYSKTNMDELHRRINEMNAGINCHEHETVEA